MDNPIAADTTALSHIGVLITRSLLNCATNPSVILKHLRIQQHPDP
jgi:hypothetical protein